MIREHNARAGVDLKREGHQNAPGEPSLWRAAGTDRLVFSASARSDDKSDFLSEYWSCNIFTSSWNCEGDSGRLSPVVDTLVLP